MSEFNLKTGDILLFEYNGHNWFFYYFTKLIRYFTNSNYSHVSMVLKDPTFTDKQLNGYYVWQSSWTGYPDSEDNELKLGVQISPFQEVYDYYKKNNGKIVVRRIHCNENTFTNDKLNKIHNIVHNKPYDIVPYDWILGIFKKDIDPQKKDRFWCSALIGYIYTMCGLISDKLDWSILRPCDFSDKYNMKLENNAYLSKEEIILNNL